MLSPREDDDDDNHLCIKCNATIVGLENYVKHRKEKCGKLKALDPKPELPPIDSLEPSYSLGADVFFQSLELQSSVKKTSLVRLTPPIPTSKPSADRKTTMVVSTSSSIIPRMSPLENNLRGEDWIGGHSLRIGTSEDNQTKLINAVASISGVVKKDIPTSSYSIPYDYKGDDDTDESEELEEDEEEEHPTAVEWKPPPNYTGGKWPPVSPDHEDWDMRDEQEHTGGKWKPFMHEGQEREEDYDAPPPGHTKGKWIPGANEKTQIMQTTIQSKGSVQYWCGPCNRRLGSRAVYEKHLKSSLHLKKVLPEHELEFAGHLTPMKCAVNKRMGRPSRFLNENIYLQPEKKRRTENKLTIKIQKKKRKRKSYFVHCSGCNSRVRQHLMGKHLISHYHFRKATVTNTTAYQTLILANMDAIVHQSPFQCSPCKFYTNWFSTFMQHWLSKEHEQRLEAMEGKCWCSFCKFECLTSQEMMVHMNSSDHSEVIAVINRSMPIIIRKKTIFKCDTCFKEFRYNIEMRQHCQNVGHALPASATDNYQELHKCQYCRAKFKSSLTLAAHLKSKHKQRAYFCLVCAKTFKSSEEAKRHRQTSEHRIRRKENMREQGLPTKDLSKKCPYCTESVVLRNILELKDHIRREHPNIRKKCPKCGMSFILSQEVTRHVRDNACQYQPAIEMTSSICWNCSQCLFTTDSQAECFFHEVLHTIPKTEIRKVGDVEKLIQKYPCPLCNKAYKKASLRQHLRQHTFERPYICSVCGTNFTRQSSLANHSKNEHGSESTKVKSPDITEAMDEWECTKCKKTFNSKSAWTGHTNNCKGETTTLACPHDQCPYIATKSSQLARHRRTHGVRIKHHECHICEFKTDQASHIKRHMMCHQRVKPYACPHCHFTCGSLENLRKHVLRSGRHPGLFLYHCRLCSYNTNTATELRVHFTTAHANVYDARSAVQAVKRHLMIISKKDSD